MDSVIEELLADPRRISVLATSDPEGWPNLAVVACARPEADGSWVLGLGANRTLANLRANGRAALLLCLPGESLPLWKGTRVYLEAVDFASSGPLFDTLVAAVSAEAGRRAGRTIRYAVRCRVVESRPLVEFPSPPPAQPV